MRVGICQAGDGASWRETSFLCLQKEPCVQSACPVTGAVVAREGNGSLKESEAQVHGLLGPSLD